MNVYYVQFNRLNQRGRPIWMLFETDMPSVRAVSDAMNEGKLIHGFELRTRPCSENEGSREVMDTREVSIRLEDVKEIGVPRWELYRLEA